VMKLRWKFHLFSACQWNREFNFRFPLRGRRASIDTFLFKNFSANFLWRKNQRGKSFFSKCLEARW
jgi:hypothetical protein